MCFGEDSEGDEEHIVLNWRKGDLSYIAEENVAELCSLLVCKIGLVSEGLVCLAEEISK